MSRRRKAKTVALGEDVVKAIIPMVPIVRAASGSSLTVEVDIENPSVNYTVGFDDTTLMYCRVDRRETVAGLSPGTHRLVWSFSHLEKDWKHVIAAQVAGQPAVTLEERSEAKKDAPYSIGLALVVIE
jgi:hypothetical protein